jgi:EAL domain-containing protein (putative c-di-GMP-specific phosphodiesterase class I)
MGGEGSVSDQSWSLTLEDVRLEPYFQPYACVAEPGVRCGELLTRPGVTQPTEEYFTDLGTESLFSILEWQIDLQRRMQVELGLRVAINVHNRIVESEESRSRFLRIIEGATWPTTFEFTETYPMPPIAVSNRLLRDVRSLGHHSALDDFGTGLNGMSLLTDYDFDIIKIDRSLVFDLGGRAEKQKTLRLVLEMLRVLGKDHVVEGVETQEILDILRELGYTTFQGYLIGMPEPVAQLAELSGKDVVS